MAFPGENNGNSKGMAAIEFALLAASDAPWVVWGNWQDKCPEEETRELEPQAQWSERFTDPIFACMTQWVEPIIEPPGPMLGLPAAWVGSAEEPGELEPVVSITLEERANCP